MLAPSPSIPPALKLAGSSLAISSEGSQGLGLSFWGSLWDSVHLTHVQSSQPGWAQGSLCWCFTQSGICLWKEPLHSEHLILFCLCVSVLSVSVCLGLCLCMSLSNGQCVCVCVYLHLSVFMSLISVFLSLSSPSPSVFSSVSSCLCLSRCLSLVSQ